MQKQALMNVMTVASVISMGATVGDVVDGRPVARRRKTSGQAPTFGYQTREEVPRARHASDNRTAEERKADRKANRKRKRNLVARRGRR